MSRLALVSLTPRPLALAGVLAMFALAACANLASVASAADWPTYRGDAARSGYTSEPLPTALREAWVHRPAHPPAPAWPRDDRMMFDRAYDAVVADGTLYYGSSAEDRIVALDAATGRERWSYFTDSPVRFSPPCGATGCSPSATTGISIARPTAR